jgi:photosystem II stability/assembly factor-like uncharacterized protein
MHVQGFAAPNQQPWLRPALTTQNGAHSVLTAVTLAGHRLVAVGERGIVLLSDDHGGHWRQAAVPVSVTLCAVQFVSAERGWAVGHGGVILFTQDGGEHWLKQLDGLAIPALIGAEASSKGSASLTRTAAQFARDGPDKPFLDVLFTDAKHGWALGGYGLLFHTDDGGVTWRSRMSAVDNPKGLSLYAMAFDGSTLYLAGEQGIFARADALGEQFTPVAAPVESSFFAMTTSPQHLSVGGLGGALFDSTDGGNTWQRVTTGSSTSIVWLAKGPAGFLIVGLQDGKVMSANLDRSDGLHLTPLATSPTGNLASFVQTMPGQFVAVGFRGATQLSVQQTRP